LTKSMKTPVAKPAEVTRCWHLVDADGVVLGRLAAEVAHVLQGKHKPIYSRHLDTGDYVVVINAAKVQVTGKKMKDKIYYRHSGYPGGLKSINYEKMMEKHPTRAIEYAVKGMLPHTKLGVQMLKKLRVYAGAEHPHQAQLDVSSKEDKE